jgi:hypothetical protein
MKNKLTDSGIENTTWIVDKFIKDMDIKILDCELALTCFKKWVKYKHSIKLIPPYLLNNMSFWFLKIVTERGLSKPQLNIFKTKLKKLTNKIAKKLFKNKLHVTKRANIFTMKEIDKIAKILWTGNLKNKASALVLRISFLSACRIGDLKNVYWSDTTVKTNKHGTFVIMPMRSSKTNPRSLRKEFITIKIYKKTSWNILDMLLKYKNHLNSSKLLKKRIFPNLPTRNYCYYFEKARKMAGYNKRLGGHSGRNSAINRLLLANVGSEHICIQLKWKRNSQMVFHYRDTLMETTHIGAPYALEKFDMSNNFEF